MRTNIELARKLYVEDRINLDQFEWLVAWLLSNGLDR